MIRCTKLMLVICLILFVNVTHATNMRCGEIQVSQVGEASGMSFKIRVSVYTNTINTAVLFGGDQDYLDLGDGGPRMLVPEIGPGHPNYVVIDASRGIAKAFYEVTHSYGAPGKYLVSYSEPNRTEGIVNFSNSINTLFYLETMFVVSPSQQYSSPVFFPSPSHWPEQDRTILFPGLRHHMTLMTTRCFTA
ncbi:MAG TPA: hypothetical protein VGK59_01435 [Ohtaekwangia sp.]